MIFGDLPGDWFAHAGQLTAATRIYQDGQQLFYDADGIGSQYEPIVFAHFGSGIKVKATDFAVR